MAECNEFERLGQALARLGLTLRPGDAAAMKMRPEIRDRLDSLAEEMARFTPLIAQMSRFTLPRDLRKDAHGAAVVVMKVKKGFSGALKPASCRPVGPALDRVEKALRRVERICTYDPSAAREWPLVSGEERQPASAGVVVVDYDFDEAAELAAPHGTGGDPDA